LQTVTCNPGWPEIADSLLPGQTATDRPDLVVRVFHLREQQMMKEIVTDRIFGEVIGYTKVIEFQVLFPFISMCHVW